jgi:hypothetical protein
MLLFGLLFGILATNKSSSSSSSSSRTFYTFHRNDLGVTRIVTVNNSIVLPITTIMRSLKTTITAAFLASSSSAFHVGHTLKRHDIVVHTPHRVVIRASSSSSLSSLFAARKKKTTDDESDSSDSSSKKSSSMDPAKRAALDGVLNQIERNYGRGSIVKLGDAGNMVVESISSGALTLDAALGGGLPKGRVVEIYGPESSGKTTLALHALAECQKAGGTAAFVDAEHALDPAYGNFSLMIICNLCWLGC